MGKDSFILRNLAKEYLPDIFVDEFGEWAFGEKYESLNSAQNYISEWNNLHGKSYQIRRDGNILHDFYEMIDMWKKFKNEK